MKFVITRTPNNQETCNLVQWVIWIEGLAVKSRIHAGPPKWLVSSSIALGNSLTWLHLDSEFEASPVEGPCPGITKAHPFWASDF